VNLVLAGRDSGKIDNAASDLRTRYGVKVSTLVLDPASLDSVRVAAKTIHERISKGELHPLAALLCNAGAQFHRPISYSKDGFEETFAINHLGHFLLVNLLLDSLADNGRIDDRLLPLVALNCVSVGTITA
jgi:NAD(P)-dependent dehydrogenase (short-subunit alcohol dehydrogenase family)